MRTLGVIKENLALETRVALVPEVVSSLGRDKLAQVYVEQGAGIKAGFLDEDYVAAGAVILDSRQDVLRKADCLVAINGLEFFDEPAIANKMLIGLFDPFFHKEQLKTVKAHGASVIALELIPRISRAQSMDVLSSQANIAGYAAVLLAASRINKVVPLMMTAAGTIKPAKFLILGAGVAGLSAIATAKRLGAVVFAYDVRPVVKEQVESLGAKFVDISINESGEGSGGYAKALSDDAQALQRQRLAKVAKDMDVVITTAQIPGRKAPLLLDEDVFSMMTCGAMVIDMASASGGNVAGSIPNEWMSKNGVVLFGADHLARMMPKDASFTYSKNIRALLEVVLATDELNVADEIMHEALICHGNSWVNEAFSKSIEQCG